MAQQYRIKRKIGSVAVVAGGFATLDLPRAYDYESIILRINGDVVVAVAGGGAVRAEAPSQVVTRAEVIADGKNNLFSVPFAAAAIGNFGRNIQQNGARVMTPPTAQTAATYTVEGIACLDFAMVDGIRPKDTNYRTSALSLFQLRLSFGSAGDLFTVAGTASFSNMYVDVFTVEMIELPDAAGAYSMPLALKKTSYQELAITASNANQEVRLPAGNLIRGCVIRATSAGEPVTTIINNIQVASGIDVRMNLSGAQVRAMNNADYGYVRPGYYVIDFMRNGDNNAKLSDAWDVTGQAEPKLILDVTTQTTAQIQVVTTEFLMAR